MTTINLRNITPEQRNDAVNEAVAMHVLKREVSDGAMRLRDEKLGAMSFESWVRIPRFATSADAVLPLLAAFLRGSVFSRRRKFWGYVQEQCLQGDTATTVAWPDCLGLIIQNGKIPMCLCIALLRAHGVTVIV